MGALSEKGVITDAESIYKEWKQNKLWEGGILGEAQLTKYC